MARYSTRLPKAWWGGGGPLLPPLSVESSENQPRFSGLFNAEGEPLYRLPRPIGFGRDSEW